ncbi:DNA adenine methylase [Mycoplasma zalophidermidis]|uniref:DNA adenine methylase n=1 Tax=Mycoplasma zalophidermidis TaxID=398174 RepID=A0ABS6DRP9_9MOLU|nr:DNA adenine methylase [Mycoplasma zalophidermidis]MBU4693656.1 DNA adenine methylase [Mycoplasma zalophidermidis]
MKPFVKWAGGKAKLIPKIKSKMPTKYNKYIEPFVGGGALFFHIQPKDFIINDINSELIDTYKCFTNKRNYNGLIKILENHAQNHNDEYFYEIRNLDRDSNFSLLTRPERAARLIYLNKSCFNGLYRVNKKGFFNVPSGKKNIVKLFDNGNFDSIYRLLNGKNKYIYNSDFEKVLKLAQTGDFVYLDPPYADLNERKSFTSYTKDNFYIDDQIRLKNIVDSLTKKDVKVMISNHGSDFIKELFKDYNIETIYVKRLIGSNVNTRKDVEEVLITNY